VRVRRAGQEREHVPDRFQERFASAYVHELQAWVTAIAEDRPAGASAWDGYAAALVSQACLDSLATGETAEVQLESRPRLYFPPGQLVGHP
jgi:myo-inositol 2-dehydrogenase / D-chiro-inositol 1-dehydrogenase